MGLIDPSPLTFQLETEHGNLMLYNIALDFYVLIQADNIGKLFDFFFYIHVFL